MRGLILFLCLLGIALSEDRVCSNGFSKQTISVGKKDSFSFNTHPDNQTSYNPDTECLTVYKGDKTCKKGIRFNCQSSCNSKGFYLPNEDPKRCRKGDRIRLGKKKYCGSKAPYVEFSGRRAKKKGLKVLFTSDSEVSGPEAGAQCTVECLDRDIVDNPCDRDCTAVDFTPMTCYFHFVARDQQTDASQRMADGRLRTVLTYNGQIPGPLLVVCEGDTVNVTLDNQINDGPVTNSDGSPFSTTLHWHGIRQVGISSQQTFGPWSDGVPFVNQCPIGKCQQFNYLFKASRENFNAPPGSYWYHSHMGAQRTNGLQGGLIIKPTDAYIFDKQEVTDDPDKYTVILQEWYVNPVCQVPVTILCNGKSKVSKNMTLNDCSDKIEVNNYLRGFGGNFPKITYPFKTNPKAKYEVFSLPKKAKFYRFRILGLVGQNFPIRISIDNARFTAIAADSLDIEPVHNLQYLWVSPGERFDILYYLPEDVTGDAIKMRFLGFTSLTNNQTALCSVAFLKFPGSTVDTSYRVPYNCSDFENYDVPFPLDTRVLNPPAKPFQFFNKIDDPYTNPLEEGNIFPVDIKSTFEFSTWIPPNPKSPTQFIEFNSRTTFNEIRTEFPSIPYLLQSPEEDNSRCDFFNKDSPNFTQIKTNDSQGSNSTLCQHVLKFPFSKTTWPWNFFWDEQTWQEIVLINSDIRGASHPIHQHGGWFWVVGEGQFNHTINRTYIKNEFENGNLKKNINDGLGKRTSWNFPDDLIDDFFINSFILPKDVIQVPNQGYVVIRTHLDNPGNFIFHCHIDFHLSIGMGLVQQIGELSDWNIVNNNNPEISSKNVTCEEPPPSPRGDGCKIDLFYGMSSEANPVSRCVTKNSNVTFFWTATTDGHNINYVGKDGDQPVDVDGYQYPLSAKDFYDECIIKSGTMTPSGYNITNDPGQPNVVIPFTEVGTYYFYCGIKFNGGSHCKDGGVKAMVYVVEHDTKECPYHPTC